MEEWKAIPGYEGYYEASTEGRIRSVGRYTRGRWGTLVYVKPHILKPNNVRYNYMQVKFCVNGKREQPLVHRLIAKTFIANPHNYPQINHKDGNGANNAVDNLEWCTASANCWHRDNVLKVRVDKFKKRVKCVENGQIYGSLQEAAAVLGTKPSYISAVCHGAQKTANSFHFELV